MWMIRMEDVLNIVSKYCPDDDGSCSKAGMDLREMLDEIEGMPETEVQPVKHGRWIENSDPGQNINEHYMCSECGCTFHNWANDNYCPNCGCKQDLGGT